jgi:hypothetical protein
MPAAVQALLPRRNLQARVKDRCNRGHRLLRVPHPHRERPRRPNWGLPRGQALRQAIRRKIPASIRSLMRLSPMRFRPRSRKQVSPRIAKDSLRQSA